MNNESQELTEEQQAKWNAGVEAANKALAERTEESLRLTRRNL